MKLFNSFQAVATFVAAPFLLGWLRGQDFTGATALFYAGCAAYVVGFCCIVACVRLGMGAIE